MLSMVAVRGLFLSTVLLCAVLHGVCGLGSSCAAIYPLHATYLNRFSKHFGCSKKPLLGIEGISLRCGLLQGHVQ